MLSIELNNLFRIGTISISVCLKNSAPIPHGPALLPDFKFRIPDIISASVIGQFNISF